PSLHREDLHHRDRGRSGHPARHHDCRRRPRPGRERRVLRLHSHLRAGGHARVRDRTAAPAAAGHLGILAARPVRVASVLWSGAVLALAALPFALSPFQVVQLTVFMVFSLLALSLDLIWGFGGILSFGQAAFFGVGGYAYGVAGINTGLS